jgi:hypothetical protein
MNRTSFLGASAGFGMAMARDTSSAAVPASGSPPKARHSASQFFADPSMNFVFLIMFGGAYYGLTDVGAALAIAGEIEDGNPASAFDVLTRWAGRMQQQAAAALAAGHRVSARESYLHASTYAFAATYFCDAMGARDRMMPTWWESRQALDAAFKLFEPAVEHVTIPYEATSLPGYLFKVDDSGKRRPLVILNNGSDGSVLDMWQQGGAAAIARGYNCLTFDGPGQGAALWLQKLSFRPDWEKVVTPVVDYAVSRPDVDPRRIGIIGISQGGYWVPRAVAFEHRIAVAVADPGVMNVATSWTQHLPPALLEMLRSGRKAEFDQVMQAATPAQLATLEFRARPYGFSSMFDTFTAVQKYTLAGVVQNIRCPMLVCDPELESFWPGQPREVYDALGGPKELVHFTVAEGAQYHCEPMAAGLRAQRIFDWMDGILARA